MQKAAQESRTAKKELQYYQALTDAYEKRNWKLQIEIDNLIMWVSILGATTILSIIGVLILFFR